MISEILLDLQAAINNPAFEWPIVQKNVKGIILEGYKFNLVCSDMLLGIPFSVSVYDPDNYLVQLDEFQNETVKEWVRDNVLPNYLNLN